MTTPPSMNMRSRTPESGQKLFARLLANMPAAATFIGSAYGRNHFYDIIHDNEEDPDWLIMTLKASQTGILSQKELDLAKKAMPPEEYAQEYECSFRCRS